MYIVFLKFSENKASAPQFMESHKNWIKRGLDENVFLLVGSIEPNAGGAILAHNASMEEIKIRVEEDPFVKENIVKAEIIQITPAKACENLNFLLENKNKP
ncbi:YciI family protein [Hyphomicrobiales bacterium 4NK60-0047b]